MGILTDYRTGESIRPATAAEEQASSRAAAHDGGAEWLANELAGDAESCVARDAEDDARERAAEDERCRERGW